MNTLIDTLREHRLRAYEAEPGLIKEHFGIEEGVLAGGYGYRQVLELVQNGADAILEAHEAGIEQDKSARIEVRLAGSCLYVANTGAPFSEEGIDALLRSHSSPKRGNQIGRFGLGFKSLLRLEGKIDIVSGPMSFSLDPDRCREELREKFSKRKGFSMKGAPGLRLAYPLNDAQAAELRGLFPWAKTVVCAEISSAGIGEHLPGEIGNFPSEFLLFLSVPVTLTLDDGASSKREMRCEPEGASAKLLCAGESSSRWHFEVRMISITDKRALNDATHIHARDSVPLSWAMPLDSKREEAGRFWAFFPTQTETRLPGILNAPWKLNSDRNAIIGGEWNTALMREAARLIAETLPKFATSEDPGRPLDAFPRQLDRKDEDAAPLVEALWAILETAKVVPDATGMPRLARDLRRHPRDNADLARQWQEAAAQESLTSFVHPACLERQRGSRLDVLAKRIEKAQAADAPPCPNLRREDAAAWFKAAASIEPPKAIKALKLAEAYSKDCKPDEWSAVRPTLAIVPSQDGQLLTSGRVVIAPSGVVIPGRSVVAQSLCNDDDAKRIMVEVMKVGLLDESVWRTVLKEALTSAQYAYAHYAYAGRDDGWRTFWTRLRAAPENVRREFISQEQSKLRVRRRDGKWVLAEEVLLPGNLVAADDRESSNMELLFDGELHAKDGVLLQLLGVREFPDGMRGPDKYDSVVGANKDLLYGWLSHCINRYRKSTNNYSARKEYLEPLGEDLKMPCGWMLLAKLRGPANTKLTLKFLDCVGRGEFNSKLKFGHISVASYPKIDVSHPLPWFLLEHGTLLVGDSVIPLSAIFAKRHEPALTKIPNWQEIQPALEKLDNAEIQTDQSASSAKDLWVAMIKVLVTPDALAGDDLRDLWAGAARDGVVPETLRTAGGKVAMNEVFVTGSPDLASRARQSNRLVVTLDEHALELWMETGARNLAELMKPEWTEVMGPPDLLIATMPELDGVLQKESKNAARCQPVSGLKLTVAGCSEAVACLMWDNMLRLDMGQLARLSRSERLKRLVSEIAAAGWLEFDQAKALETLGDARVKDELRAKVAQGATLSEKLLSAVGNREEPLRSVLGYLSGKEFMRECTPIQLAELVLAQLGPATLTSLTETLTQEGLNPPDRWGTAEARDFVASIGFPSEYAASSKTRREAEETISGPIFLPPLHDFQEEVSDGLRGLICGDGGRRRGVVSLPTGGGKTRVTVQAAVDRVLKPQEGSRSVIWVAQTDELCEQAVQAFRQVWINRGTDMTDLRIIRLWGRNKNPVIREENRPIVVVASIQTLNSRMWADGLDWLKKPGLVVVDECHHAITPSYTNLLRWLDAEAPKPGAPAKDEPPIIGLSATPFRTDDEESARLAKRFDNRWLPAEQEGLYERLRDQGVISHVDHEPLRSPATLLEDEIKKLSELHEPWEGIDFENILEQINQRLAGDEERNRLLVECCRSSRAESILFFANSVSHAKEMAARLHLQGVSSAAISGDTPSAARRHFVKQFQQCKVQVLCNHTVLATGFDAPKTDMILISRQVFSPVRYMQMVGRGMRGEKNGGTARCRIVTVLDNLGRFQDKHPYHFCAKYFS
jgi:superfamily II DNA or RNA helicase